MTSAPSSSQHERDFVPESPKPSPSNMEWPKSVPSDMERSKPVPSDMEWPKPIPSDMRSKHVPSDMEWPEPVHIKNWATPPPNIPETKKQPIVRRISRAIVRYSIVFLMAIGGTLAWQSYSDEAIEMVRTEVPSLAWLLPVSATKPSPDGQAPAAAVLPSAEVVQQLKPMAVDLAIVRRNQEQLAIKVEQLAAKQEQMAQNIATLQSVEQEVIQKLSSPPQPRVAPAPKPPQPTGQSSTTQSPSVARPVPPSGQPLR
jgi:hypothetical protein